MLKNCSSCGKQTKEYSVVPDPNSSEAIIRCKHCRQLSVQFETPSGVKGP
ncbi:RNA-binding protein [Candidatus Micrarchaeota archaeon CG10_big_fil_rev_8_21_14_0_10_45_29]|nr:MAG: RNA-binding protein [Candidatus Micrarchaeota archaeon CG10_big_fil_rev_8_21_14_0_10_45_29]